MTRPHSDQVSAPPVAVIVLNWNAWADTLECVESLLRMTYPCFEVILCDNASTDGSLERFAEWAAGDMSIVPASPAMAQFVLPPVEKPLTLTSEDDAARQAVMHRGVTLIRNHSNLGYAAGNNAGLRHAQARQFEYFWVLNADTVVEPGALDHFVARARDNTGAGLFGSLLCYYDAPQVLQEAGGCRMIPFTPLSRRLAPDANRNASQDWRKIEASMDYVSGASCFTTRDFLDRVGLMSEDYFLYCEEIDWATRAKGQFDLALVEECVVYHKKGLSTGSKGIGRSRSIGSTYYLWRARRRFCQRYNRVALLPCIALGIVAALALLIRGDRPRAAAILDGIFDRPRDSS